MKPIIKKKNPIGFALQHAKGKGKVRESCCHYLKNVGIKPNCQKSTPCKYNTKAVSKIK